LSNDHFQFKQFRIDQKGSSLKVCTDSCLFGAWVADTMPLSSYILDIGTGTGLLALMVAQKHSESQLVALEIDPASALLASQNIAVSPWSARVKVEQTAVQNFISEKTFDCILSNPPFFENQLPSNNPLKNLAKHQSGLTREELLASVIRLLSKNGAFFVLFPEVEGRHFQQLALEKSLLLQQEVKVRSKASGPVFRVMQKYGFEKFDQKNSELIIYKQQNVYTLEFIELLKEYYLALG
jgi:tRNA1Val (adenine37-N6)-methyltransferase